MTRVPTDDPERLEPTGLADRLAGEIRRQLLAAAQAGLRTVRQVLAQFPGTGSKPSLPAGIETPPSLRTATDHRTDARSQSTSHLGGGAFANPPPAELLRTETPLPDSYGSDRIVLLARDPHCLHAYWDLSDARGRSVRSQAGSHPLRMVLRTYDVTQVAFDATPPARFQDFAVVGDARSVYAYVGKPAACFVAEVGYLRPDGAFFPLARSEPIWTPRTDQPGAEPDRWMTVGWHERAGAGDVVPLVTTGAGTVDTGTSAGFIAARRAPSSWPGPLPSAVQHGSWSLVRGGLTTAASPDDPPAARSEP